MTPQAGRQVLSGDHALFFTKGLEFYLRCICSLPTPPQLFSGPHLSAVRLAWLLGVFTVFPAGPTDKIYIYYQVVAAHVFNLSTREAEAGETHFCEFKAVWCIEQVLGQLGLYRENPVSKN